MESIQGNLRKPRHRCSVETPEGSANPYGESPSEATRQLTDADANIYPAHVLCANSSCSAFAERGYARSAFRRRRTAAPAASHRVARRYRSAARWRRGSCRPASLDSSEADQFVEQDQSAVQRPPPPRCCSSCSRRHDVRAVRLPALISASTHVNARVSHTASDLVAPPSTSVFRIDPD